MEYTILYNSSIAIGIMAIVMTTALLTFVLTYYIVKKVKEQDIIKALAGKLCNGNKAKR
jgi:hypothetical protein